MTLFADRVGRLPDLAAHRTNRGAPGVGVVL